MDGMKDREDFRRGLLRSFGEIALKAWAETVCTVAKESWNDDADEGLRESLQKSAGEFADLLTDLAFPDDEGARDE